MVRYYGKKILRFSEIVLLRSLWRVSAALHAGVRCRLGWEGGGGILSCDNSFKKMLLESDAWTDIS